MTFYAISKTLVRALGRLLWRVRAYGGENVPASGAVIIACNHVSYLDPPIVGAFCPRRIHYMAKRELFRIPLLGSVIRALGAYPVDREGSAASAIKRSVEILRRGEAVGIFPEGARNRMGLIQARRGVALLAAHANAPVVPAAITGSSQAIRLARIKVLFGPPLHLESAKPTKEQLEEFTTAIMTQIRALSELGSRK
jgi:1-acyl-sn-glycerol-3-phosphate acyltransferase